MQWIVSLSHKAQTGRVGDGKPVNAPMSGILLKPIRQPVSGWPGVQILKGLECSGVDRGDARVWLSWRAGMWMNWLGGRKGGWAVTSKAARDLRDGAAASPESEIHGAVFDKRQRGWARVQIAPLNGLTFASQLSNSMGGAGERCQVRSSGN